MTNTEIAKKSHLKPLGGRENVASVAYQHSVSSRVMVKDEAEKLTKMPRAWKVQGAF